MIRRAVSPPDPTDTRVRAAKGREVSGYMVRSNLEMARRAGIDPEPLLQGLSFDIESLRDRARRVDWDDWAIMQDRLMEACGGGWHYAALASELLQASTALRMVAGTLVTARRLYLWAPEAISRRMYLNVGLRTDELVDGRVRFECVIPEPYRTTDAMLYGTIGGLRVYPKMLGQSEVPIEYEASPRRMVFIVTPPEAQTAFARARRRLEDFVVPDPLVDTDLDLAFYDSAITDQVTAFGRDLLRKDDAHAVATAVIGIMRRLFCCRYVAVWAAGLNGMPALIDATPDPRPDRSRSAALTVEDREIGRIEVDAPLEGSGGLPFFEALVPWVAAAIERSRSDKRSRLAACLERLERDWGLSCRQSQVLGLLATGCSNKEIACALGCTLRTAEVHVTRLFRKAAVTTRGELLAHILGR